MPHNEICQAVLVILSTSIARDMTGSWWIAKGKPWNNSQLLKLPITSGETQLVYSSHAVAVSVPFLDKCCIWTLSTWLCWLDIMIQMAYEVYVYIAALCKLIYQPWWTYYMSCNHMVNEVCEIKSLFSLMLFGWNYACDVMCMLDFKPLETFMLFHWSWLFDKSYISIYKSANNMASLKEQ